MRIKFEKLFIFSIALLLLTLPMPKYNLSTQALILLVISWFGVNSFQKKKELFVKNLKIIILLSSIFLVMLFGMIYTENLAGGIEQLKDKLPFLLLPILIATSPSTLLSNKYSFIKIFSLSVILMAVFGLLKSLYLYYTGMGNYFVYDKLSFILNKHTTYYSLYCVIAISYFLYDLLFIKKTPRIISVLSVLFLLFFIYLLSVRIAIVALIIIAIYFIKIKITNRSNKVFLSLLVILSLVSTLIFSSNYVERFESIKNNPDKIAENNEFNTRIIHWKSALQTVSGIDYFIGKGTGDGKKNLYKQYKKNGFLIGYEKKYNVHNQYLEFLLSNGLIAILAYISILLITLVYSIRVNDIFGILVVLLFVVYSLTESILERQSGIFIVAILCNILFFSNREVINKLNKQN